MDENNNIHPFWDRKKIIAVVGALLFGALLLVTRLDLFKANLLEGGIPTNSNEFELYVGDYTALSKDKGNISIRTGTGLTNMMAITFMLKYNPNQIQLSNEVTLGSGFVTKPEMVVITPDNTKGEATIDIASSASFTILGDETIMEIPISLKSDIPEETKININFSEVQLIDSFYNFKSANTRNGEITILASSAEALKVLNAEAVSPSELGVFFDDYLKDTNLSTIAVGLQELDGTIGPALDYSKTKINPNDGKELIFTLQGLNSGTTLNLQKDGVLASYNGTNFSFNTVTPIQNKVSLDTGTKISLSSTNATFPSPTNVTYLDGTKTKTITIPKNTKASIGTNVTIAGTPTVSFSNVVPANFPIQLPNNTLITTNRTQTISLIADTELVTPLNISTNITETKTVLSSGTNINVTVALTLQSSATDSAGTIIPAGTAVTLNTPANINIGNSSYTLTSATSYNGGINTLPIGTVLNLAITSTLSSVINAYFEGPLPTGSIVTLISGNVISLDSSASGISLSENVQLVFNPDMTYRVTFANSTDANTPRGNSKSPQPIDRLATNHVITFFATKSISGTNKLQSLGNSGTTTLVVQFSSNPDALTAGNPVKYLLFDSSGNSQTISEINLSGTTATIKLQRALVNGGKYFLIAEKVANMSEKKILHFFVEISGETKVLSVTPESVTSKGGAVVVTGANLNEIQKVKTGTINLPISGQSAENLTLTIPSNLEIGIYDFQFETKSGQVVIKQNFLLIEDEKPQLEVISEESYSSPRRVPNDGKTKTKFWILITDPRGVGDINKVTLDLRQIDGPAVAQMIGTNENGQPIIVDNKRWFYLETVVPKTVKTSETPKEIKATVEDPRGNKAYGTISLTVTKNVRSSELPEVLEAYAVPTEIKENEKLGFYAYVKDLDGISDIDKVIVDLGPLGLGPRTLISADAIQKTLKSENISGTEYATKTTVSSDNEDDEITSKNPYDSITNISSTGEVVPEERITQWYGIEDITVPVTTEAGNYDIKVIATDKSGEQGIATVSITISRGNIPHIDKDRTEVTPRDSIPNDGKEKFSIITYVSDEDGIQDVTSVLLDLQEIGVLAMEMDLIGEMKEGQKGGYFTAKDITIPRETMPGVYEFTLYAYDKAGNEAKLESELLRIEVTDHDEVGTPPVIDSSRSYTTPAAIPNDETTKVTFNVFVEQHDFEITQVMVDLANVAKFIGNQSPTTSDASTSCLGATGRMVCMTPGLKEGTKGQWYVLHDIVALKDTPSSMEPYRIRVTATDEKGKNGSGFVFMNIGDGTLPTPQTGFPKVQMTISSTPENVEVLFSNPVDPKKVGVGAFKITETNDTTQHLAITDVVMNADATVATLTTHTQLPGAFYTLFADAQIIGLKEAQYTDNHADFTGFDKREIPPQIVRIKPLSSTLLEVIFSEGLRPSSVSSNGRDFQIFTHEQQPVRLGVQHVEFRDDNQTIRVSTEPQSNMKYTLRVKNILSAAGVRVGGNARPDQTATKEYFGIHEYFIGYKARPKDTESIIEAVDFDKNGKIDFTDFTIFSSVYGQTLNNSNANNSVAPGASQFEPTPLNNIPNATIPATSSVNRTEQDNISEPVIKRTESTINDLDNISTVPPVPTFP